MIFHVKINVWFMPFPLFNITYCILPGMSRTRFPFISPVLWLLLVVPIEIGHLNFMFYINHPRYWFQSHALKWRLMIVTAYQISGKSTVCLTVCSDWQLRKHQSFALLALYGRWIPLTSQWCKKKNHAILCQGTKWPPFRWRTFQIHFLEWRYSYFESKFIEICSQLSN